MYNEEKELMSLTYPCDAIQTLNIVFQFPFPQFPAPSSGQTTLAPLEIRGIMDGEHDPGGPYHAGKQHSAAANRRLRR